MTKDENRIKTKRVKLRDLTEEQYNRYMANKCAFNDDACCVLWLDNYWLNHKELYSDNFLDKEIEIEVEE